MTTKRDDIRPADHAERMQAAMRVAGWHLGYRSWAEKLVGAYLFPDEALGALEREMGEKS